MLAFSSALISSPFVCSTSSSRSRHACCCSHVAGPVNPQSTAKRVRSDALYVEHRTAHIGWHTLDDGPCGASLHRKQNTSPQTQRTSRAAAWR